MRFFDAACSYGFKRRNFPNEETTLDRVLQDMEIAGVEKAVLFHHAQDSSLPLGNDWVTAAIKGHDNLYGIWSMLPASTGETPPPDKLPALMKEAKIIGLRFNPTKQQFHLEGIYAYLRMAEDRRIPIFVNTGFDLQFNDVWAALKEFPNLTVILSHWNCWPADRILRPLLERFPNFYLSLTNQFTQDGIESLADFCGAKRLLFGSDYPDAYMGAQMMNILNARIPDDDKEMIASGNLERILSEIKWDDLETPLEPVARTAVPAQTGKYNKLDTVNQKSALARRFIDEGPLKDCPIIDFHAHMHPFNAGFMPAAEPEQMIHAMDKAGVALTVFASHLALDIPACADTGLDIAKKYPSRFKCYRVAHPQHDAKQSLTMMDGNPEHYIGFKLHPDGHKTPMSSPVYAPYWEYANNRGLPCLCHTWGGSPYNGIDEAEKILKKYSNLILLAGHAFSGEWGQACELANAYPNMYLELCAVMDDRGVLEMFCERVGSERILFGLDLPWFSYWYYIGAVCAADITDEDRLNIFYKNGAKLLSRYEWFGGIKGLDRF
jgi:hypothetical protein